MSSGVVWRTSARPLPGHRGDVRDRFRSRFLEGRQLHGTAWCWSATYGPSLFKRGWRTRAVWGSFAYDYLQAHNKNPACP